jgi:hypothetical protein
MKTTSNCIPILISLPTATNESMYARVTNIKKAKDNYLKFDLSDDEGNIFKGMFDTKTANSDFSNY